MEKKKVLIVSPHLDDTCFALCGSIMKEQRFEFISWNIFTKQDYSILKEDAAESMKQIYTEDLAACTKMNVQGIMEDLPEAALRGYKRLGEIIGSKWPNGDEHIQDQQMFDLLSKKVKKILETNEYFAIGIPLGCGEHIDHILCREAMLSQMGELKKHFKMPMIFMYEELPYAFNERWNREVHKSLELRGITLKPILNDIENHLCEKAGIMALYKSQVKERDIKNICDYSKNIEKSKSYERIWLIK